MTDGFKDAISIVTNHFEQKISGIKIELFHGGVQSAFDTLLDTLGVDTIYVATLYRLHCPKWAFDPLSYIMKSTIPYHQIAWIPQDGPAHEDRLEEVFL